MSCPCLGSRHIGASVWVTHLHLTDVGLDILQAYSAVYNSLEQQERRRNSEQAIQARRSRVRFGSYFSLPLIKCVQREAVDVGLLPEPKKTTTKRHGLVCHLTALCTVLYRQDLAIRTRTKGSFTIVWVGGQAAASLDLCDVSVTTCTPGENGQTGGCMHGSSGWERSCC